MTVIFPPAPASDDASRAPDIVACPPSAKSNILPPCSVAPFASIMPVLFITDPAISSAAFAVIITVPLLVWIRPLFSICAAMAPLSTLNVKRPSPVKSRLTRSPAAKRAGPLSAEIYPLFFISGAINATYPPLKALILPSFIIEPASPLFSKLYLPSRKFSSEIFSVDAVRAPASTWAVGPKYTPEGLSRKT